MTAALRPNSLKKAVNDFRKRVCSAILSNLINTQQYTDDIEHRSHIVEVSEEYCLALFLNWIATKYGFPAYSKSIDPPDFLSLRLPLFSWNLLTDQYPLYRSSKTELNLQQLNELYMLMDTCFDTDISIAGQIYQESLSNPITIDKTNKIHISKEPKARLKGEYYSPLWVVDYCFDLVSKTNTNVLVHRIKTQLNSLKQNDGRREECFKIIDPACGSGNFLLGSLNWLQKRGFTQDELYVFANSCLYGRDIDGRAISLCRTSIIILLAKYFSQVYIQAGEEICASYINQLCSSLSKHILIEDSLTNSSLGLESQEKFDLILGNPPYISFGARNQSKVSAAWQNYIKRSFPQSSEYKIRLHSIFQEIAIRLGKPGGQIALLVPDAFLNGSFYKKLREFILNNCQILSLTELPDDTIYSATVGRWCIAHYGIKQGNDKATQLSHIPLHRLQRSKNGSESWSQFFIESNLLISKDKYRFQLLFSEEDANLFKQLSGLKTLSSELQGHTGIRAKAGQASIIAKQRVSDSYQKGIISGGQIYRYGVFWQGDFLDISPEKLFAGGFDKNIISTSKILVRQTGDRLIAAVDNAGLYHLNNAHSFKELSNTNIDRLHFYCGLLNSSFFLYIYRLKSREYKRALAQIDIDMVESLPLPNANTKIEELISKAAIELHRAKNTLSLSSSINNEFLKLERVIDSFVYELFALSESQKLKIENELEQESKFSLPLPSFSEAEALVNELPKALHFSGFLG